MWIADFKIKSIQKGLLFHDMIGNMVTVPERAREQHRREKVALEAAWYIVVRAQRLNC